VAQTNAGRRTCSKKGNKKSLERNGEIRMKRRREEWKKECGRREENGDREQKGVSDLTSRHITFVYTFAHTNILPTKSVFPAVSKV
jgi:hypothetical protein